jgi:hypothetical protein
LPQDSKNPVAGLAGGGQSGPVKHFAPMPGRFPACGTWQEIRHAGIHDLDDILAGFDAAAGDELDGRIDPPRR